MASISHILMIYRKQKASKLQDIGENIGFYRNL